MTISEHHRVVSLFSSIFQRSLAPLKARLPGRNPLAIRRTTGRLGRLLGVPLALLALSIGAQAQDLSPIAEVALPVDYGTPIGLDVIGSELDFFTTNTYYTSPLYSPDGSMSFSQLAAVDFTILGEAFLTKNMSPCFQFTRLSALSLWE